MGAGVVLALISLGAPSWAQSAADKATARELASEGIRKFKAGDATGALYQLEKAQALYDAPVHLLYIARAHVALGHLVEGAETYRLLVRAQLASDAPAVFLDAQSDGEQELEQLEPRIGRLIVDVQPEELAGLELTIDGKQINAAAVGIPIASNPGRHVIVAEATGYESDKAEVNLGEGKSKSVALNLKPIPGFVAAPAAANQAGEDSSTQENKPSEAPWTSGPMGFIAGFKVGGVMPVGELEKGTPIHDYFGAGAGGRLDLGFRFLWYLGIKGYVSGSFLQHGNHLTNYSELFDEGDKSLVKANQGEAGVSLLVTSDPRKLGAFAEVGYGIGRVYSWTQEVNGDECGSKATYKGWGARVGGGVNVPVARVFTLVPTVDLTLGQLKKRSYFYGCTPLVPELPDKDEEELDQAMHYQFFLGVGGDFHFGDDWFR